MKKAMHIAWGCIMSRLCIMDLVWYRSTQLHSSIVEIVVIELKAAVLSADLIVVQHLDWLVQERRNSIANTLESICFFINPSI